MSNERDELADIIKSEYRSAVTRKSDDCYTAPADAILAAGYRKPRTITTAEELDALAFESVVRDAGGHVLERWGGLGENLWTTVMVNSFIHHTDIDLPATVLYEPTA